MKKADTLLSRAAFSIGFIAAIFLMIIFTNLYVNQRGENAASATSLNKTILTNDNQSTAVSPNQNNVTAQLIY
jgi:hypothetical protein